MKILITGINGFIGSYLTEYLIRYYPKSKIYGLVRPSSNLKNISHLKNKIKLIKADILNYKKIASTINLIKPHWIFHLAADISPRYSKKASEKILETNIIGTLHLLKASKNYAIESKIFIASSAAVYGNTPIRLLPIKENIATNPIETYGSSKVCAELLSKQYYRIFGLKIIIGRTFNLLAPARGHLFIESNFINQIKLIKAGKSKPIIKTGDINTYRDFIDVRDAVKAYVELIKNGQSGEIYNICSNKMVSIRSILNLLLEQSGLKNSVKVIRDASLIRPIDIRKSLGSNRKIIRQTGWRPEILINKTLSELLKNENLFTR